jgi:hypothetical protein
VSGSYSQTGGRSCEAALLLFCPSTSQHIVSIKQVTILTILILCHTLNLAPLAEAELGEYLGSDQQWQAQQGRGVPKW